MTGGVETPSVYVKSAAPFMDIQDTDDNKRYRITTDPAADSLRIQEVNAGTGAWIKDILKIPRSLTGGTVWTDVNDGNGSGLDADTVRGFTFRNSNGYLEYWDGGAWQSVGVPVMVASNNVQHTLVSTPTNYTPSGAAGVLYLWKFIPKGEGEVAININYGLLENTSNSIGLNLMVFKVDGDIAPQTGGGNTYPENRTPTGTTMGNSGWVAVNGLNTLVNNGATSGVLTAPMKVRSKEQIYIGLQTSSSPYTARVQSLTISYDVV